MGIHTIKKGLDLPITGSPKQVIENSPETSKVAIVATEFVGMKARMAVEVGDEVKRGQLLFEDRKNPGVLFTAPGAGKVTAINRGAKRALLSLVIELNDAEKSGNLGDNDHVSFESYTGKAADELEAMVQSSHMKSKDTEGLLDELMVQEGLEEEFNTA